MASRYWVRSTAGTFQHTSSWSSTSGGSSGSSIPSGTDTVIFDRNTVNSCNAGVSSNAETGGVAFALLHVKPGFTGDLGTSAAYFHTAATKIVIEGSGTYYLQASDADASAADVAITTLIINNINATVYIGSDTNDGNYCHDWKNIKLLAGTLIVNDSTAFEKLYVAPTIQAYATVVIGKTCARAKATAYFPSIWFYDGTGVCNSKCSLIQQTAGTFSFGVLGSTSSDLDILSFSQDAGTFNWYPAEAGAFITGDVFGGIFDASAVTNSGYAKSLGNGAGYDFNVYSGATIKLNNTCGNITVAGSSKFSNYGATIITDNNSAITLSYDS